MPHLNIGYKFLTNRLLLVLRLQVPGPHPSSKQLSLSLNKFRHGFSSLLDSFSQRLSCFTIVYKLTSIFYQKAILSFKRRIRSYVQCVVTCNPPLSWIQWTIFHPHLRIHFCSYNSNHSSLLYMLIPKFRKLF